ncbi:MAG: hypothetical protein OHK0029_01570 [Armatimonadaceae bacterium]
MRTGAYPSANETAIALFDEAVRHLTDARILFDQGRYPAAITSAHKAQELAVKAALVLENAMGFWEKLFKTHKPLTEISASPALNILNNMLNARRRGLAAEAQALEKFEPKEFTTNTEYPFHPPAIVPVSWVSPADEFAENDARRWFNVAHEVVEEIQNRHVIQLAQTREPLPASLP